MFLYQITIYFSEFAIFSRPIVPHCPQMTDNVPAVYDVWAGIKGLCEAMTARPNVPE
jgi:hypothetical protein